MAHGCMLSILIAFCFAIIEFSTSSPTRRQSISISETTSVEPAISTSNEPWGDSDDFDLDGEGWLKQPASASSMSPGSIDYGDYDDYSDDDDNLVMDAEEDEDGNDVGKPESEFLFLPPKESRLRLQDDDDDDSHIKVRHTGKYAFSRNMKDDDDDDEDEEEHMHAHNHDDEDIVFEGRRGDEDHSDDHILPVAHHHFHHDEDEDDNHINVLPKPGTRRSDTYDDSDDHIVAVPRMEDRHRGDDEDENNSVEDDDDNVFESPEEETADVIYGDHVFLY